MKSVVTKDIDIPKVSPPSRGAWIEIMYRLPIKAHLASPPSRGAWIEIVRPGTASP